MKWIFAVLLSFSLFGCSHSSSYYRSPPDTCDGALGCVVLAVMEGIIHSKPAPKKCAEMSGEQREKCNAQVDAITKSIEKAQGN
ncbi:hypothetical protein [uncultured Shewanella sp.]|uniref:hypothetical protein n=1 Tax=uncultured Shewanella sp. TaxID=173975 RepID=UPI00261402E3|nr:hypothetical protein [uncultured Shewanella sp.]